MAIYDLVYGSGYRCKVGKATVWNGNQRATYERSGLTTFLEPSGSNAYFTRLNDRFLYPLPVPSNNFSPTSLSTPKLWIDASAILYTDADGITLATADGDVVLNAPDNFGQGNTLTRSSGAGGVLRIENTKRVIEFAGGYLNCAVSSGSLSAFSLYALVKMTIPVGNHALFAFGAGGDAPFLAPTWVSGQYSSYLVTPGNIAASGHQTDANYRVIAHIYNGSTLRTFLDGAEIGSPADLSVVGGVAANSSFTRAGYSLGKETAFNNALMGRVAEFAYYEAAHDPTVTLPLMDTYLRAKWSALLNTTDPQVLWVSNSLGTNFTASQAHCIPYLVGTASSKVNRWISGCRPSITTAMMLGRVIGDYDRFAVSPETVAVIWEGTNDIAVGGVNAATAYAHLVSLAQSLKAGGFTKIVVGTILPRTGSNETTRTDANVLILANTTDFDAHADVGGDATIGAAGANLNATYYADGIHMTDAGNDIAAPIFRTAIDSVLP